MTSLVTLSGRRITFEQISFDDIMEFEAASILDHIIYKIIESVPEKI